jgi:lipoprotein NlpD
VRLVKEGQNVVAGQEIAEMGNSGAPRVELHFEIRKDGKPLNPQDFLPRR